MENFRKEVISGIRSCLISTKGMITLRQLEGDYRTLLGERIPYQRLGFKSLEAFIQSEPTLLTSYGPNGELLVDAQVTEKSAHISSMVQKQKSSSSGSKKRIRFATAARSGRTMSQPPTTPKWRPKKAFNFPPVHKNGYERSPRLAAVSHNQFVSGGGYRRPTVPSRVVQVPNKSESQIDHAKRMPQPLQTSSPEKVNHNHTNSNNTSPEKHNTNININTNGNNSAVDDDSVLKNARKRIMNMNLQEQDSGHSSPTSEYKSQMMQEFTRTGDPVTDIRAFAAYHKLGDVEVKFTETKSKKAKYPQCHCKIAVGQHKYSSYPEDFFDKEEAQRHAAQKALDDLTLKYSRRRSLLLSSNDDIIARIPPMLEKHNSAVWTWQIEADYLDKYSEQLPADWLQVIDNSSHVSIEKCLGGYVLKYCNPDDKGKKMDISLNLADVSVPCNTVDFGDNNSIYASITAALSTNEIWCQQCGTPEFERFAAMSERMEHFYEKNRNEYSAKTITKGSCYVVNTEGGWVRARALDVAYDGQVSCFLIDYGEEVQVPAKTVYILKREFAFEQAQAFVCRLRGLEELAEVSSDSDHLVALVGRDVIMELVVEETSEDITLPVVMYDVTTSKSINADLISCLTIESALPVLDKGVITEVYISNIESNGDVYVQVRGYGFQQLNDMLSNIIPTINEKPQEKPNRETPPTALYLVYSKLRQRWLRACVIDWAPKGDLAQVYFVDEGNAEVVNVATEPMYALDKIDDVISQYPHQAVKVRILVDKIPPDFVERAERLLPRGQPVLLKIGDKDNEEVPWVEFFKRTPDGVLVFINKSIVVEAELRSADVGTASENSKKRLMNLVQFGEVNKNVPSGGSLKKPELPTLGDYFNVNIPFAVNPYNFFIQPLDTLTQLTNLMADMQEYYKKSQFTHPLSIDEVCPGNIYASKHEDGLWYRTSVLKVIHSGSISVFYCDFGYYTNLTVAQLVPLDARYMTLPYQALKAKIAGIKPSKNKWTMEDCDFFNNLVLKKQFVSILVNIEKDELYKSDIILELLLIDTSSEEDVNIKEILIQKGIATNV